METLMPLSRNNKLPDGRKERRILQNRRYRSAKTSLQLGEMDRPQRSQESFEAEGSWRW